MNKALRINLIIFYFWFFYAFSLMFKMDINNHDAYFMVYLWLLHALYIIYLLIKQRLLYISITIKIIIFTILIVMYFMFDIAVLKTILYGFSSVARVYYDGDMHVLNHWYEILYWNFIYSLHYPIYIFIFIKPFVNHLDKSIKKLKQKHT